MAVSKNKATDGILPVIALSAKEKPVTATP